MNEVEHVHRSESIKIEGLSLAETFTKKLFSNLIKPANLTGYNRTLDFKPRSVIVEQSAMRATRNSHQRSRCNDTLAFEETCNCKKRYKCCST